MCKGCSLCVTVCPKGILCIDKSRLNSKGYCIVKVTDQDKCISCAFCARICPDCALGIYK
ncbi:MAG TPA: 4Fe-4S binding protein [Clostridia bacterium]|nr:4Fe-4S binding protein [Clostridia bacterium]